MRKLRIIFRYARSAFCFFLFGNGALALSGIVFPAGWIFFRDPVRRRRYFVNAIRFSWAALLFLFWAMRLTKMEIRGRERLKNLRGNVIVANHPSLIDIVYLIVAVPNSVCLVKSALAKNFIVRTLVNSAFLPNDASFPKLLAQTKKALDDGFNLIIFPEMTRTRLHEPSTVHNGAFYFALNANAPVLPIKISPTQRILAKDQPACYAGDSYVRYDIEPLPPLSVPAECAAFSDRKKVRILAARFREICLEK